MHVFAWLLVLALSFGAFGAFGAPKEGKIDLLRDLNQYEIARPVISQASHRGTLFTAQSLSSTSNPTRLHTLSRTGVPQHVEMASFKIQAFDQELMLDLQQTEDLVSNDFTEAWVDDSGGLQAVQSAPREMCYYHGQVRGDSKSVVTASTCNGLDAMVWTSKEQYVIKPSAHHPELASHEHSKIKLQSMSPTPGEMDAHVIFRKQDLKDQHQFEAACGVTEAQDLIQRHKDVSLLESDNDMKEQAVELASKPRHLELMIVNDNAMFLRKGRSRQQVQDYNIQLTNAARALYQRLDIGITVTLVAVLTFTGPEPSSLRTSPSESMATYLNRFTSWRQAHNGRFTSDWKPCTGGPSCFDLRNGNAQLLTGTDRSGGMVGLAWVGAICSPTNSAGVIEDNLSGAWQFTVETLTHEMGHNFGASHDGSGNTCESSKFMMASSGCSTCPFSRYPNWSSCSDRDIRRFLSNLERRQPSNCLSRPARPGVNERPRVQAVTNKVQILEDTGAIPRPTISPAAVPSPAVFQTEAEGEKKPSDKRECLVGPCCSPQTFKFKPAGTLCRRARNECDLDEFCSGNSGMCGEDVWKMDGTQCAEAGVNSKCYQGSCVGADAQCKESFRNYAGNWVYQGQNGKPGSCGTDCGELKCTNTEWDDYCFSVHCRRGETCQVAGNTYEGPVDLEVCNCASLPSGDVTVRDGTPCGDIKDDKICVNNMCVPRDPGFPKSCTGPNSCNNRGVCNNKGGCSCNEGYFGERCESAYKCPLNCSALHRGPCRSEKQCGLCLPGYEFTGQELGPESACELAAPRIRQAQASTEVGGSHVGMAFDGRRNTAWVALANSARNPPIVRFEYESPIKPLRYSVSNGVLDQSLDPSEWTLEGSTSDKLEDQWDVLDHQRNVVFSNRAQSLSFPLKAKKPYKHYRLKILAVRDPDAQGSLTLIPHSEKFKTSDGKMHSFSFDASAVEDRTAKVQLGGVKLMTTSPASKVAAVYPEVGLPKPGVSVGRQLFYALLGIGAIGALAAASYVAWRMAQRAKVPAAPTPAPIISPIPVPAQPVPAAPPLAENLPDRSHMFSPLSPRSEGQEHLVDFSKARRRSWVGAPEELRQQQ